jgi:hypothetical protein
LLLKSLEGIIDAAGGEKVRGGICAGGDGKREEYAGEREFHGMKIKVPSREYRVLSNSGS